MPDLAAGALMLAGFLAAGRLVWPQVLALPSPSLRGLAAGLGLVVALLVAWFGYGVFKPDLGREGMDWATRLADLIAFGVGFWLWMALALAALLLGVRWAMRRYPE